MLRVGQCISHVSGGNLEEKILKIFEKVGFPIREIILRLAVG